MGTRPGVLRATGTRLTCCPSQALGAQAIFLFLFVWLFCLAFFLSFRRRGLDVTSRRVSMLLPSLRLRRWAVVRSYSYSSHSPAQKSTAWLFIDSVFPVKLAAWESAALCPLASPRAHPLIAFDTTTASFVKNVFSTNSQSSYRECPLMASNPSQSSLT
jgi:hypothetical protein